VQYQTFCVLLGFHFVHYFATREEPLFHPNHGGLTILEARKIFLPKHHHFNENNYFISVFLQGHEAEFNKISEQFIVLPVIPSKYIDALLGQLERSLLEFKALAWCIGKQEAIVNMNNVSFIVDHYVLVVAILYLEDVLGQRVTCQTVAEILLSFLKPFTFNFTFPVLYYKVVKQCHSILSLVDLVDAHCVVNDLDQATVWASSQNFVWLEPNWKLFHFENLVDLRDQLHRELFLPNIVHRLHDHPD